MIWEESGLKSRLGYLTYCVDGLFQIHFQLLVIRLAQAIAMTVCNNGDAAKVEKSPML